MKQFITLDYDHILPFINIEEIALLAPKVKEAHQVLHQKTGAGNEFLGWLNLPETYNREEFKRILLAAEKIKNQADVLVVIGIGGSYLGAKAAIEALTSQFTKSNSKTQVIFAGQHLSSQYLHDLLIFLEDKDWSINVISKSGTTTEPAIAFRILRQALIKKYGLAASKERIYVTTDQKKGALNQLANEAGYETFVIPEDIGGRFSVLTPVGLLPMAVSGIDIKAMMKGAYDGMQEYASSDLSTNPAYLYAAIRNCLYQQGKQMELLVTFEPQLGAFAEWWKQLFGESEGKDHRGLFPVSVSFTTDLHSLGQIIQDGPRNLFETFINIEQEKYQVQIPHEENDLDQLNYLAGKTVDYVNRSAFQATTMAHLDGGVPNLTIKVKKMDAYGFGYLVYFFEKAVAISGYLLGVNPFNQPGVEAYKQNMFALLEKPGYEALNQKLKKRFK